MTYRLDGESEAAFAARRGDLVREAAVLLEACGAELLKLEYPGSAAACAAVTAAIGVPWAVLSAGVGHDEFRAQLAASLAGGAAGFIAGRSLWKESVGMDGAERRAFLDGVVRRRFAELVAVLDAAWQLLRAARAAAPAHVKAGIEEGGAGGDRRRRVGRSRRADPDVGVNVTTAAIVTLRTYVVFNVNGSPPHPLPPQ